MDFAPPQGSPEFFIAQPEQGRGPAVILLALEGQMTSNRDTVSLQVTGVTPSANTGTQHLGSE